MIEPVTRYLAAPFARRDDGAVVCDGAIEYPTAEAAVSAAERLALSPGYIGAWAFSRAGWPAEGFYDPPEVLRRFGSL